MDSITEQFQRIIEKAPYGSAFVVSDFTEISDYQTAKRTLARLCETGLVRRVIRGVYDKPAFSELINEYSAPDPNEIAMAIARNYNWTVIPSGEAALNLFGLSTQVPAKWEYCSSGPYRTYEFGRIKLEFKHRSNKEIEGLSYNTALLIQAIKALGKESITDEILQRLKERVSQTDKDIIAEEARYTTSWVYSVIKTVCSEE